MPDHCRLHLEAALSCGIAQHWAKPSQVVADAGMVLVAKVRPFAIVTGESFHAGGSNCCSAAASLIHFVTTGGSCCRAAELKPEPTVATAIVAVARQRCPVHR